MSAIRRKVWRGAFDGPQAPFSRNWTMSTPPFKRGAQKGLGIFAARARVADEVEPRCPQPLAAKRATAAAPGVQKLIPTDYAWQRM